MLENIYFLHLNLGFWFIGLPFGLLLIYTEYKDYKDKKDKKEELIQRLPNGKIYLDLTQEEKFMLNSLVKQSEFSNADKFLRQAIKEILEEET